MKNNEEGIAYISVFADDMLNLRCNISRDEKGTLYFKLKKYIEKIDDCYYNMFRVNLSLL